MTEETSMPAVHWTQTPEGRKRAALNMRKRHKRGDFKGDKAGGRKAKKKPAPELQVDRTLYALTRMVRAELHAKVRSGAELTPYDTTVLQLTDRITRP